MITTERRAELRALADAATPGPWEMYDANDGSRDYGPMWCVANDEFHNPSSDEDAPWLAVEVHVGVMQDASFIATARTAVPELLDEIDRLTRELAAMEVERDNALYDHDTRATDPAGEYTPEGK